MSALAFPPSSDPKAVGQRARLDESGAAYRIKQSTVGTYLHRKLTAVDLRPETGLRHVSKHAKIVSGNDGFLQAHRLCTVQYNTMQC